ncbi:MAG: IPExxxVDY family protein [Flavobacteriaceae bacterium]|nr:IPExxxVDY family protein [Flavobacteriaceae bacterium]
MSKIHAFDFEFDHDYTLIGIHSILEDYRMAYFLNQNLKVHLNRFKEDLDFPSKHCSFSFYNYEDKATFTSWSLIANKHTFTNNVKGVNNNLFKEETKTSFLIPEKKNVDYFIKICGNIGADKLQNILSKINNTDKIITSYAINPYDLKSKDYLIF